MEIFILLGVPILLFPIFTLLDLSFLIILIIEILLYSIFRLAARVSPFDYGLVSFIYSKFIWPKKLSAYQLDERKYIKDQNDIHNVGIEMPKSNKPITKNMALHIDQ